jgi:hypothetical protein
MAEDYFGNAAEWGDDADGGQVRGSTQSSPTRLVCSRRRRAGLVPAEPERARPGRKGGVNAGRPRLRPPLGPLRSGPAPRGPEAHGSEQLALARATG